MGGVDTEGGIPQERGHLIGQEPPAPDGDAGGAPLLFLPQRGGHADGDFDAQRRQLAGKVPPSVLPLNTTALMRGTPAA